MAASFGLAILLLLRQVGPGMTEAVPPDARGADFSARQAARSDHTILTVKEPEVPSVAPRNPPQFEVGALAELRSGHPYGGNTTAVTEVEVDPIAALRLPVGPGGITIAYDPRIIIIGSYSPTSSVFYLHQGRLLLDTQTPRARYFLTAYGAYGQNDFLPLSTVLPQSTGSGLPPPQQPGIPPTTQPTPTPTPSNGTLPDQRFLEVARFDGTGGLVYALSPTVSWLASAGYAWSGGANATAQQAYPVEKGPYASTGPIWSLSPTDILASLLHGYHSRFSNGPLSTGVDLSSTWTHEWTRSLQTDLIGGVSVFHSSFPDRPETTAAEPIGGFAIRHSWIRRLGGWRNSLQVLVAPLPDRLSGVMYERVSGTLVSTWAVNEQLSFNVSGSGTIALDGTQGDARVEGRVSYLFAPELTLSVGGRAAWLQGSQLLGPTGFGWVALVTVTTHLGSTM